MFIQCNGNLFFLTLFILLQLQQLFLFEIIKLLIAPIFVLIQNFLSPIIHKVFLTYLIHPFTNLFKLIIHVYLSYPVCVTLNHDFHSQVFILYRLISFNFSQLVLVNFTFNLLSLFNQSASFLNLIFNFVKSQVIFLKIHFSIYLLHFLTLKPNLYLQLIIIHPFQEGLMVKSLYLSLQINPNHLNCLLHQLLSN